MVWVHFINYRLLHPDVKKKNSSVCSLQLRKSRDQSIISYFNICLFCPFTVLRSKCVGSCTHQELLSNSENICILIFIHFYRDPRFKQFGRCQCQKKKVPQGLATTQSSLVDLLWDTGAVKGHCWHVSSEVGLPEFSGVFSQVHLYRIAA